MISVHVRIAGILRKPRGMSSLELALDDGATAADIPAAAGYSEQERKSLRVRRGDEILNPAERIGDGDELNIFAAIGGG